MTNYYSSPSFLNAETFIETSHIFAFIGYRILLTMGLRIILAIGCLLHASFGQDEPAFLSRCGDCWCIPEGGTIDGTCPELPNGIWQSFPDGWGEQLSTFTLTSDRLTLRTAAGDTDCYPFLDAIGSQVYSRSSGPQCQRPLLSGGDSGAVVCAYKYADDQACRGREYDMSTYATAEAAVAAGAYVTHSGACGVCSNAQDLGVRMSRFSTLQAQSIFCATAHAITRNFPALIQCYETLGFTNQCSLLWAHFGATNGDVCASKCIPDPTSSVIELFESAPTCALLPCLNCSSSQFEADFDIQAGIKRSVQNSGFNDDIPLSCDSFYEIEDHDPCVGAAPTFSPAPAGISPTKSSTMSAAAREPGLSLHSIMMMVTPILLLIVGV